MPVAAVRKIHFKQAWWSVAPVLKCLLGNSRVPGNSLSLIKTKLATHSKARRLRQSMPSATKHAVRNKVCHPQQSLLSALKHAVRRFVFLEIFDEHSRLFSKNLFFVGFCYANFISKFFFP